MIKLTIWMITVIGLLPVALLAVWHLLTMWSLAKQVQPPPDSNSFFLIGEVYVQFGSQKLHISPPVVAGIRGLGRCIGGRDRFVGLVANGACAGVITG